MKKGITILLVVVSVVALTSCDKETILGTSDIPTEISKFTSDNFPNNKILQVTKERDGITRSYEVILDENISLDFNRKKEVTSIDATTELPASVVPSKLSQYVASNFPTNFITDWEIEGRNQQIGLDNGLELEFNMAGEFLRMGN